MATLAESASWVTGIYQLEIGDPVLGGPDGIDNLQAKQLASRTSYLKGQIQQAITDIGLKAPLASPALTGTPTAPTAVAGTSTTQLATTAFVTTADNLKAPLASPALTGTPTAPTAVAGTSTTQLATTAFVTAADNLKAPLASPALTGTPTAPTAAPGVNTTQLATTAFVQAAVATLVDSSPATLDTLNELAAALGDDPNFATSMATALGYKAPLASPALTGTPTAPTAVAGTNTTQLATTAFVTAADNLKAPLASPAFTGAPTAPTAADGTNSTQVASTAFVQGAVGGYLSKAVTGGTVTLTDAEASNPVIALGGALTSNLTVVVPTTIKRLWAIYNATTGAFTVTVKTAAGTGVTVAQGKRNLVYTDGTNVLDGFNDFESVALTGAPTAPTAAAGTSTTQLATTAFVQGAVGIGAVNAFAMSAAPSGWLKANGALVSRTTYAALFAAIGTTFGAGDGSTTFALPDLRGEFVRGWDNGRGVDTGRTLGSAQADDFKSHTHRLQYGNTAGANLGAPGYATAGALSSTGVEATGGTETRPRNIALLICIKY